MDQPGAKENPMFDIEKYVNEHGHEQLIDCNDPQTGLRAWIAIHNTKLGPGLGGIRLWNYESADDALLDVLRLSEGMTYKAAVAGLKLGGAKAVILGDGKEEDPRVRRDRFRVLGRIVDDLKGRYIAAEDVGTTTDDIIIVREETYHVVGLPSEVGGSGDPSPMTAIGVLEGQRALIKEVLHTDRFKGVRVSIQGLGKVGFSLASRLVAEGAYVIATDINPEVCHMTSEKLGIRIVKPDDIYNEECEIFAPCALGGVINDDTLVSLRCRIVAGSANNQLKEVKHGEILHEMGIVYAVDYVINAGGLINVSHEMNGYDREKALADVAKIYDTIMRMYIIARRDGISEQSAAHKIAIERLLPEVAPG